MARYFQPHEVTQFVEMGYVVAPAIIPPDVVAGCRRAMWEKIGMREDDPSTWPAHPVGVYPQAHETTLPCRSPAVDALVEQLVGPHFVRGTGYWPVLSFPRPGPRQWRAFPGEHVDGHPDRCIYPTDRLLIILCYLTDTEAHGGPLAVRPGSHMDIFHHHRRAGRHHIPHELMLEVPFRHELQPIPGRAGDVVFLHYMTSHSSSWNHADHVRVGLNANANVHPQYPYRPRTGPPQPGWTPLDISLRTDREN
ncbi:MAG: phytanoyl-CoA dioxygenase family protein [Planctomycetota bacterium]|nr:phytanoyl-CoA dioxygenase family protein [Planctomycetota bacterium]